MGVRGMARLERQAQRIRDEGERRGTFHVGSAEGRPAGAYIPGASAACRELGERARGDGFRFPRRFALSEPVLRVVMDRLSVYDPELRSKVAAELPSVFFTEEGV